MGVRFSLTDKRLIGLVSNFLKNHLKKDFVENYMVDYNNEFNRIVVNVFINRDLDKKEESKFSVELIDKISDYIGRTPFVYFHFGSDYQKHKI